MKSIDAARREFNVAAHDQLVNFAGLVDPGYLVMPGNLTTAYWSTSDKIDGSLVEYRFGGECKPSPLKIHNPDEPSLDNMYTKIFVSEKYTKFFRPDDDEASILFAGVAAVAQSIDLFSEFAAVSFNEIAVTQPGTDVRRIHNTRLWGRLLTGSEYDVDIPLVSAQGLEDRMASRHPFRTKRERLISEFDELVMHAVQITDIIDALRTNALVRR